MIKKFMSMFAIAAAMLATSCSNEELVVAQNGKEATVTFTAELPAGLQTKTRAFGDGTTAKNLSCFVYDENWTYIEALSKENLATMEGLKQQVNLKLVNGETYHIVFWADATDAPYTFSPADGKVHMNYKVPMSYTTNVANAENRDAFVQVVDLTVNGASVQTVPLKRPFAQINIGTSDWAEVLKNTNVSITKTGLKVATYSTFNFNGQAASDATTATFVLTDMPAAEEEFPNKDAKVDKYLSMNYILVESGKELVDVTIDYDGGVQSRTFTNVPVQRNYRTNIYGKLITTDNDFNVEIKPGFDGEHDFGTEIKQVKEREYEINSPEGMMEISKIIESVPHGEGKAIDFYLKADVDMSAFTWVPMKAHDVNFYGEGHTISNLNCGADATGKSGFCGYLGNSTIENVTLHNVTAAGEQAGIVAGHAEAGTLQNVTISGVNNVSYMNTSYDESWGGVGVVFGVNPVIDGRSVGVTIKDGTVTNVSKIGMITQSADGNKYAMLKGVQVTADNGNVRDILADGIALNNATQTYEISNANGLVYANENLFATSGNTYKLVDNIDMRGREWTSNIGVSTSFTFDGDGHLISNWKTASNGLLAVKVNNQNVTIKNLKLDQCAVENATADQDTDGAGLLLGMFENHIDGIHVVIENCHVTQSVVSTTANWSGALIGYATEATTLTIKDCSVTSTKVEGKGSTAAFIGHDAAHVTNIENATVKDCTIKGETLAKSGIVVGTIQKETSISVADISGNKVYDVANSNAVYGRIVGGVLYMDDEATVHGNDYMPKAFEKGVSTINLTEGTYAIPTNAQGKTLTLTGIGNRDAIVLNGNSGNLYSSTITFNNLTIEGTNDSHKGFTHIASATYNSCHLTRTHTLYGPCHFNNCLFSVDNKELYNVWTYGTSPVFTGCQFNCAGKSILIFHEGATTCDVTFDTCTFNASQIVTGKAAIQMHTEAGINGKLTINKTTATGFDSSINGGLWNEVNNTTKVETYNFDITVDGTQVH